MQLEKKNQEIAEVKGEAAANSERLAKWEEEMSHTERKRIQKYKYIIYYIYEKMINEHQ